MRTRKSPALLDLEIKQHLRHATRKRQGSRQPHARIVTSKPPTYTVQPRNLWRMWDFPTLPEAIAFGLTLKEPFDVSVDSGAIVWGWGQRPLSEAEAWGQEQQQRGERHPQNPRASTRHATKKRTPY